MECIKAEATRATGVSKLSDYVRLSAKGKATVFNVKA